MSPLRDQTAWLRGAPFSCLQPPVRTRVWRLILLGPPGVGKGTQARLLADVLGACPLSMADVFRTLIQHSWDRTTVTIADRLNRGLLLPDDYVLETIRRRRACLRCRAGFLLDGYPRTRVQAAMLDALLVAERVALDAVIRYDLAPSVLINRMSGRRVCPHCRAVYHIEMYRPQRTGICDHCAEALVQLPDDQPEAVKARFETYLEATEDVAQHYDRLGLLVPVSAEGQPADICAETLRLLRLRGLPIEETSASQPLATNSAPPPNN